MRNYEQGLTLPTQFYVRILLKPCFPSSLQHPALVHCAEMCLGAGGVSAVVSVTRQKGGHGQSQLCLRPTAPKSAADPSQGQHWGFIIITVSLLRQRVKGGRGEQPLKSSSLDFLTRRLKKFKRTLPSPQKLPKLPKGQYPMCYSACALATDLTLTLH